MQANIKKNFFMNTIIEHINKNAKAYILSIILFFIGLLIGILCINNTNREKQEQISAYINNFTDEIMSEKTIDTYNLTQNCIKRNTIIIALIMLLGSTVIGMPLIYAIIIYKGYSLGYTISAIFATLGYLKGMSIIVIIILPYLAYIPVIIATAVNSLNLYQKVVSNRREENLKISITKHILFGIVMLILIILTSILESYIIKWIRPVVIELWKN